MSNDIKVGDVAEIVGCCCDWHRGAIGLFGEVVEFSDAPMVCDHCNFSCSNNAHMVAPDGRFGSVPIQFLRKKPPKQQDDAEPCLDHIPAEPEFIEDLQRRLSKTTEPA